MDPPSVLIPLDMGSCTSAIEEEGDCVTNLVGLLQSLPNISNKPTQLKLLSAWVENNSHAISTNAEQVAQTIKQTGQHLLLLWLSETRSVEVIVAVCHLVQLLSSCLGDHVQYLQPTLVQVVELTMHSNPDIQKVACETIQQMICVAKNVVLLETILDSSVDIPPDNTVHLLKGVFVVHSELVLQKIHTPVNQLLYHVLSGTEETDKAVSVRFQARQLFFSYWQRFQKSAETLYYKLPNQQQRLIRYMYPQLAQTLPEPLEQADCRGQSADNISVAICNNSIEQIIEASNSLDNMDTNNSKDETPNQIREKHYSDLTVMLDREKQEKKATLRRLEASKIYIESLEEELQQKQAMLQEGHANEHDCRSDSHMDHQESRLSTPRTSSGTSTNTNTRSSRPPTSPSHSVALSFSSNDEVDHHQQHQLDEVVVRSIQTQLLDTAQLLEAAQQNNMRLVDENHELTSRLHNVEQQLQADDAGKQVLADEIMAIRGELDMCEQTRDTVTSQLEFFKSENAQAQHNQQQLQEHTEVLRQQLSSHEMEMEEYQYKLLTANEQIEKLSSELNDTIEKLSDRQAAIEELTSIHTQQLENLAQTHQSHIEDLTKEHDVALTTNNCSWQSKLDEMSASHSTDQDVTLETHKEQLSRFLQERECKSQEHEELVLQLKQAHAQEIACLQVQLAENTQQKESELAVLRTQMADSEKQLARQVADQTAEVKALQHIAEQLEAVHKEELGVVKTDHTERLKHLQAEHMTQINQLNTELGAERRQVLDLGQKIDTMLRREKSITPESQAMFEEKVKQQEQQQKLLQEQLSACVEQDQQKQVMIDELQGKSRKMKRNLSVLMERESRTIGKMEQAEDLINRLQVENERLIAELDAYASKPVLMDTNQELEGRVQELQQRNQILTEQLTTQTDALQQAQKDCQDLQERKQTEFSKLVQDVDLYRGTSRTALDRCQDLEEKLSANQVEHQRLTEKLKQVHTECRRFSEQFDQVRELVHSRDVQIREYKQQLAQHGSSHVDKLRLSSEMQTMSAYTKKLEISKQSLEQEVHRLKEYVAHQSKNYKKAMEAAKSHHTTLLTTGTNNSMLSELKSLQAQVQMATDAKREIEKECLSLKKQLRDVYRERKLLDGKVQELKDNVTLIDNKFHRDMNSIQSLHQDSSSSTYDKTVCIKKPDSSSLHVSVGHNYKRVYISPLGREI